MMSSIGTLMVDSFATGYYKRLHFNNNSNKTQQEVINGDEEIGVIVGEEHQGHVHIHTHATHGHAHGSSTNIPSSGHREIVTLDLIRHRIISQVSWCCAFNVIPFLPKTDVLFISVFWS